MNAAATLPHGAVRLTDWGVIRAHGADAAHFLHHQLTQDVSLLGTNQVRLAGYCNAKGRLQASFVVVKNPPDEVLLLCRNDLLAAILKQLKMFVLRAKVTLEDASTAFALYGLLGDAARSALGGNTPAPWTRQDADRATRIALYPADGVARALWLTPADGPTPRAPALDAASWHWAEVRAGIAPVAQATFELFVPQMLNYESVGGVNFKKGCYPGQEVVARSQFRGTLKRRAYLAHSVLPLAAGDALFTPDDTEQPCGTVALPAPAPTGGFDAIVSLQISAFEAGTVIVPGHPDQPLALAAPPYPLLVDI
ncbi:MAG: folate-binding protein YgfZ [Rhodoferax sp.]